MDDSVITCNEIIKSYEEEIKTISKNFNEKKSNLENAEILYFSCIFINYYRIIDSL